MQPRHARGNSVANDPVVPNFSPLIALGVLAVGLSIHYRVNRSMRCRLGLRGCGLRNRQPQQRSRISCTSVPTPVVMAGLTGGAEIFTIRESKVFMLQHCHIRAQTWASSRLDGGLRAHGQHRTC